MALSLGANARDPEARLIEAIDGLAGALGSLRVAPLFRTEALPRGSGQPPFLNTAVTGVTELAPENLLALAKALEWIAGRRPAARWGPRPLDVDLLLYGERELRRPELTVPHPCLAQRRFYLAPLARVAPNWRVPPGGCTVAELLAGPQVEGEAEEIGWSTPPGRP